jgi:hypothetical protein
MAEQLTKDLRQKIAKKWKLRLDKEAKAHKDFRKQAKVAEEAARDDDESKPQEFNIHWANCKIVRSAVYGRRPVPDVRRRYQKPDPEEKELARMVERALEYQLDVNGFDWPSGQVVKDFVEAGLGVPRVIMDVETQPFMEAGEVIMGGDGEPLMQTVSQDLGIEHIPYKHFAWEPGKSWDAVDWVAFRSYRPRKEVERDYDVEISAAKDGEDKRKAEEYADEIPLWEIWSKPQRMVIVLAVGHPEILEMRPDELKLKGFFPVPRPLFANLKSDELIPKPDYELVRSQIEELNRITQRKKRITAQIKAVGYYDASIKGMERLKEAPDGTLQPVENLPGAIDGKPGEGLRYLPIGEMIATVRELEGQAEAVKNTIYEVIGIADIIRGSSKASETAAAQNIKGQWANVRLSEKSGEVARIWRDVFRMMAEIICEHFRPEILQLQTGVQITPRMVQMMQSDIGRTFAIDVETDSTIAQDDQEERASVLELLKTLIDMLAQLIPAVQSGAIPVPFAQEMLIMALNRYKHGKQLEDAVYELGQHIEGMIQFQQQMQQLQQALQQRDQQIEGMGQQMQGMQQALGKFNAQDEMRKTQESRADVRKTLIDAEAQMIENRIVAKQEGIDTAQKFADLEKTEAETDKIEAETLRPVLRPVDG